MFHEFADSLGPTCKLNYVTADCLQQNKYENRIPVHQKQLKRLWLVMKISNLFKPIGRRQ